MMKTFFENFLDKKILEKITNIQRKLDSVISLLSLAQKQSSAHKVEGGCQVDRFFC